MTESLLNNLPGTRDLLPDELDLWQWIESAARDMFARYGYREIRTPIIEATELFARGIGGETDIVGKEMYTFRDQSGKSITLRPEATASVVRAYLQHAMHRGSGLSRMYYMGPMFRHEKKQKGRWRQFYQIGAEVFGSDHPAVEAEAIEMLLGLFRILKVDASLQVNSVGCPICRPPFMERLRQELRKHGAELCGDCRRRTDTNSLRVLDCKVESCQPVINGLPRIDQHLCENCARHFAAFKGYLDEAGIAFQVVPRLVRGLDYYVRTAFELTSGSLGSQNAVAGGGRYDGLAELLGGPPAHGFGFALGLDRLAMLAADGVLSGSGGGSADVFIAYLRDEGFARARSIARVLRGRGIRCALEFGGGSLKSQLRLANRLQSRYVIILGEEELARNRYVLRRMADSQQWEIPPEELENHISRNAVEATDPGNPGHKVR